MRPCGPKVSSTYILRSEMNSLGPKTPNLTPNMPIEERIVFKMYAICPNNLRFLVKKAKFTKLNFSQGGSAEISLILDSYQPNGILTGSIFTFFGSFQKRFFLLRDSVQDFAI